MLAKMLWVLKFFRSNTDLKNKRYTKHYKRLGDYVNVPKELEANFLSALSFYPELKNTRISVKYHNIKTTMQCRPRWDFLFHKRAKRSYVIYVDKRIKAGYGISYGELPLNAQIGVFGHELAHVVDYTSMNNLGVIRFGLDYLNHSKRKSIENSTDLRAIEKGLGHHIVEFAKCIFENSDISKEYLRYKLKFYFRPNQIEQMMLKYPVYNQQRNPYLQDQF